ncbi:MurR/RpiR family transcriptional regulator [Clostridium sp. MSJ-4]|uniref:MurR/RpiR family transcriptional regulator n=1 Tax=Clostridium simiarum TaxID=2841506 RepID=A0ABS6EVV6_9CLOT|nr:MULTISPECIES: MurR/RpiR family transcriptional regulator [Clostridium]MBU5590245.1 MurR/RpiR family transcriptional regulator [Clostridium simiarum]
MNLSKITEKYDELTHLERKIVEYIVENPENVLYLTAMELAQKVYASKTTIINFCKKLGFDGYSELRYYVKDFVNSKENQKSPISYKDILNNIYSEISKTLSLQNEENIKKIIEVILASKVVYIIARGASKPIADLLSSRLALLKVKSIFINDHNLLDTIGENLTEGESLLIMSLSGETDKIKTIAKVARTKNVDVIALTSFSNNSLQNLANYKMFCFADDSETKYNDVISRLGLHTLAQIIINYMEIS